MNTSKALDIVEKAIDKSFDRGQELIINKMINILNEKYSSNDSIKRDDVIKFMTELLNEILER